MGDQEFTASGGSSKESKAWAKKEGFQLIGSIYKGEREYQVIICPSCHCPRFVDYKCDTCAKREMEGTYKEFDKKISELRVFLKHI